MIDERDIGKIPVMLKIEKVLEETINGDRTKLTALVSWEDPETHETMRDVIDYMFYTD